MKNVEILDINYDKLLKVSQKLNISVEDLLNHYIATLSPLLESIGNSIVVANDEANIFLDLKDAMQIGNITQNDIATTLNISSAAVTLAIQKKSTTGLLGTEIKKQGIDKFLINVFMSSRYLKAESFVKIARQEESLNVEESHLLTQFNQFLVVKHIDWKNWAGALFAHIFDHIKQTNPKKSFIKIFLETAFVIQRIDHKTGEKIVLASKNETSLDRFLSIINSSFPKLD